MTHYEFLLSQRYAGVLDIWFDEFSATERYRLWMRIYELHLAHPEYSQLRLAFIVHVGHSSVQRAIEFMSSPLRCQPKLWVDQSE